MRERIRDFARRFGIEIGYFPPRYQTRRLGQLLSRLAVDVVLDIGANQGQYAHALRSIGEYRGRIVSLEPGGAAFSRLEAACKHDSAWDCRRLALMDRDGEMTLHVAAGDDLSSFNTSTGVGRAALPPIATRAEESVPTARLDSVYEALVGDSSSVFVKIDVQGSERYVLDGAPRSLGRAVGLQLELPLIPIYEDEVSASDTIGRLDAAGFRLVGVEPLFFDAALGLNLGFDALFLRHDVIGELVAGRMTGS